ncbi:DNA-binding protein [Pseudomonas nitroreducens]|uniref:DNA-binding protein n=1 Tax=Pseudomonas nitroreducens TaxID=46680 RepID=UPI0004668245
MSRIGITKQAVKTAIDLLRSQGNPVTVRAVQAVTGGSFTTVSRLIDELKREEIELLGDGGQVKIELATLVESLHERLKADAMQRIQEGEDRCTARVQEIEGHLNEVKAAHKATLDELSVTTKLLETKELNSPRSRPSSMPPT